MTNSTDVSTEIRRRVDALDWRYLTAQLGERGHAITPTLLTESECGDLADLFDGGQFRSTIDMARYRFGDGRYRLRCVMAERIRVLEWHPDDPYPRAAVEIWPDEPGAAVDVVRVGHQSRERAVRCSALRRRGRVVDRRPSKRMDELEPAAQDVDEFGRSFRLVDLRGADPERFGRAFCRARIRNARRSNQQQYLTCPRGQPIRAAQIGALDARRDGKIVMVREWAIASRQLQHGQRIATGLADQPLQDVSRKLTSGKGLE